MTKAVLHPSLRQLSGAMGEMVFKVRNGQTIVGMRPHLTKEPTQAQVAHQERFRDAVLFAKSALATPALREFYEPIAAERGISIYALAVGDYLNEPSFKPLDLSGYKGQVNDPIRILAKDDLGMAYVQVKIVSQLGALIESGDAVEIGARSGKWLYTATAPVALGSDVFIEVTGADHAGTKAKITENPTVGEDE